MRKTLSDALYGHHRFSRPPPEAKDRCVVQAETSYGLILNDALSPGATRGEARVAMDARLLCLVAETEELYAVELVVGEMIDEETAEGVKAVFETLAREIAEDIADALHGQLLTRHLSDADITAALATSKRVGVLMEAASEAGERKIAACIDHLIPLVKHDKTWVAQRAGAALGLIGEDQPAVLSALASMTEGPDPERHFVAINALGDIGGDRALRYLDTMAIGHPTDAIRALARQTVDRVRGRTR